jgi:hypothetical protein
MDPMGIRIKIAVYDDTGKTIEEYDDVAFIIVPERLLRELDNTEKPFYIGFKDLLSKGKLVRLASNVYRIVLTK